MREKNEKNETAMKIFIAAMMLFAMFVFSTSLAFAGACTIQGGHCNPVLLTEKGVSMSPYNGYFIVNSSNYPADTLQAVYNLQVQNNNIQGMTVALQMDSSIQNYVSSPTVYVPGNSILPVTIPLQVWIGGPRISGTITVNYMFDDGQTMGISVTAIIFISGSGLQIPPGATCTNPSGMNGCRDGIYRTYSCYQNQLQYVSKCTSSCCVAYGGRNAVCSSDRSTCLSPNDLPPATEGNIALVCNRDDCSSGIEQKIKFLLQLNGWNVVGKSYKTWTEDDLNNGNYKIIVCADEAGACDMKFNSQLYNAHFIDWIPVLEIPSSSLDKAAYDFGYASKSSAAIVRDDSMIYNTNDAITSDLPNPDTPVYGTQFVGVPAGNLNSGTTALANSSDNKNVLVFKADAAIDHGRYAYFGLLSRSSISDISTNGQTLLNNLLQWLKAGKDIVPNRIEKVAYICSGTQCIIPSDISFVKFLRQNRFNVVADSMKNWMAASVADIGSYKVFVCDSPVTCNIPKNSNIYSAVMTNPSVGFVEIPGNSRLQAAYLFGFVPAINGKTKSSNNVTFTTGNQFGSELLTVDIRMTPMAAYNTTNLPSVMNVANVSIKGKNQNVSAMFYVPTSGTPGTHGTYMFIGWMGRFDLRTLTDSGKNLLLSAVNWVECGKISC